MRRKKRGKEMQSLVVMHFSKFLLHIRLQEQHQFQTQMLLSIFFFYWSAHMYNVKKKGMHIWILCEF